jgi:hypothetical protein
MKPATQAFPDAARAFRDVGLRGAAAMHLVSSRKGAKVAKAAKKFFAIFAIFASLRERNEHL